MGAWNRLTDVRGKAGRGDWKGLAEEHMCIYEHPRDTDNNVGKAKGAGGWGLCRGVQRGGRCGHL